MIAFALLVLSICLSHRPAQAGARTIVAIQPLGEMDPALVRSIRSHVESVFRAEVEVLPFQPLPRSAFYPPRRRYRGKEIIASLETGTPRRVTKVLGLMSRDLSVTKGDSFDWGVFGVAALYRRAGVVSVHRLGRHDASSALLDRRARQVAAHELGHTFGLRHCRSPRCIMNDAEGSVRSVDRSSGRFCDVCSRKLGRMLRVGGVTSHPRKGRVSAAPLSLGVNGSAT